MTNPILDQSIDYERGFIDGMQKQMQSSVDKAVNRIAKREWVGLTNEEIETCAKEHIYCEDSHYNVEDGIDGWDDFAKDIEAKLRERNT